MTVLFRKPEPYVVAFPTITKTFKTNLSEGIWNTVF